MSTLFVEDAVKSVTFLDFRLSQGNVAIHVAVVAEIIVVMHRQFSYESTGERILKAGPHLPKLLPNIKWLTF